MTITDIKIIPRIYNRMRLKPVYAAAAFLLVLGVLYALVAPVCYIGRFNDDARHYLAAQSLLQGHYRQLATPDGAPVSNLLPGYPLLLALAVKLGGAAAGQWENILFSVLTAGVLLLFKRNRALAVLAALHPAVAVMSGTLMTEPAYLLFTVLVFLLYDKSGGRASLPLVLAAGFAVWLRPHGAILLVILTSFLLSGKRDRKTLGLLAAGAALAALPFIYNMAVSGTPASYFSELPRSAGVWATITAQFDNIASNIVYTFRALPVFMIAGEFADISYDWLVYAFATVFWSVFAVGVYRIAGRGEQGGRLRLAYTLAILLMHLYWVNQSTRYYLVILPFVLEICAEGISFAPRRVKQLLYAGLLFAFCYFCGMLVLSARSGAAQLRGPVNTAAWIKAASAPDAVFMATYKEKLFYLTGRKTQGYYYSPNPDDWYERVCALKTDYLLIEDRNSIIQNTPRRAGELDRVYALLARQTRNSARFERVFADAAENTAVYRVLCPQEFAEADALMRQALKLSYAGDFSGALKIMDGLRSRGLAARLDRFDFNYGTTMLLSGDSRSAAAPLAAAVSAEPDFTAATDNLARACAAASGRAAPECAAGGR